jgi:hypothetical protein
LTRVAVIGFGRLGRLAVEQASERAGVQLVAAVSQSRTVSQNASGPPLTGSIDECVLLYDPDVFLYCGPPGNDHIYDVFLQVAGHGRACISLSGQIYPEVAFGPERLEALQRLALETGSRLTGAGWNPGFLMDAFILQVGSSVPNLRSIRASRVAESRNYGPAVLADFGIGRRQFDPPPRNPHYPLDECVHVIASGLGKSVESVTLSQSVIRSARTRSYNGISVGEGQIAGVITTCVAEVSGASIRLEVTGLFDIDPAVDGVEDGYELHIEGGSSIDVSLGGNWIGDSYAVTAGRGLGAIAPLLRMPPGAHPVHHLPVG